MKQARAEFVRPEQPARERSLASTRRPQEEPEKALEFARTGNQQRKCRKEKAGPGCAFSMRRLRRFLRSTTCTGASLRARTHSAHFLHTFPLFGSNNHNKFGHKYVLLQGTARQKMIADLHIRHR